MHTYVYIYYIYTHNGMLFSHIKEWNIAICSNMNELRDYHTEWSKSDRERQMLYDITHMRIWKIIQMNVFAKQKQAHRHRKQTYGYQKGRTEKG